MQITPADTPPSLTPLRNLFPQYIRKYSIHIKQEMPTDAARCPEPMELDQPSRCPDVIHASSAPLCSYCSCALNESADGLVCDTCLTVLSLAPLNNEPVQSSATWCNDSRSESNTPSLHGVRSGRVSKSSGSESQRSSSSSDWSTRPSFGSPPIRLLTIKSLAERKRKADREKESRAALKIRFQQHEDFVRKNGWGDALNHFKLNKNNSGLSGLVAKKLIVLETSYKVLVWQKDELTRMKKEREEHQAFIHQAAKRIPRSVWEQYGMLGGLANLTLNYEAIPPSATSNPLYFTPESTASPQPDPHLHLSIRGCKPC